MAHLAPALTFAMELRVRVDPPVELGETALGRRRIIPIRGGTFAGPDLNGDIVDGGADWQIVQPDGVSRLDTRYLLRTDRGELVYIQNAGVRHAAPDVVATLLRGEPVDPALVYFRTTPSFETSAPRLQWLTRAVFIGDGERHPDEVVVRIWKVE